MQHVLTMYYEIIYFGLKNMDKNVLGLKCYCTKWRAGYHFSKYKYFQYINTIHNWDILERRYILCWVNYIRCVCNVCSYIMFYYIADFMWRFIIIIYTFIENGIFHTILSTFIEVCTTLLYIYTLFYTSHDIFK